MAFFDLSKNIQNYITWRAKTERVQVNVKIRIYKSSYTRKQNDGLKFSLEKIELERKIFSDHGEIET